MAKAAATTTAAARTAPLSLAERPEGASLFAFQQFTRGPDDTAASLLAASVQRRVKTLGIVTLVLTLGIVLVPVLELLALLYDIYRWLAGGLRGPLLRATRCVLLPFWYLFVFEFVGPIVSGLVALVWYCAVWPLLPRDASAHLWWRWNSLVRRTFNWALFGGASRIANIRWQVEGLDEARRCPGPAILLMRHSSAGDTPLPQYLLGDFFFDVRYVLKKELLSDPMLDIQGLRGFNFFIRRGNRSAEETARETAQMVRVVDDFAPGRSQMLCIWPEGTRFTEAKRRVVLESLRKHNDTQKLAIAEGLKHLIIPRTSGILALLEKNTCADLLICVHYGLEFHSVGDTLGGDLAHSTISAKFFRVPFKDIPRTEEARTKLIFDYWKLMDNWIDERKRGSGGGSSARSAAKAKKRE